jgi:serine/threonine-protein kinase
MAPEMTRDDASEVEERTDVYLLGATLHHILTGRPRHVGDSVFDAMFSACRSEPFEYGPGVPAGLAAIANRACALEPNDRFESAAAFRQALHEWRDHRGSIEVAREALQSLETLTARLDTERSAESDVVIHDLAGECRFGFRQALRMWPNNDVAQEGERRFLERMLDFYVSSEQAGAGRATLAELGDRAGPDMVARVDALERELAAKRRKVDKLEKMADELDLRTAATSRSRLALMLGVLWTLSTSYAAYSVHHGPQVTNDIRIEEHLITAIRSVLIVAVSVFIFRKRIFANLANRRLIYILFSVMFTMIMMRTVFWLTNTPYVGAQAAEITLYGMACVVLGIVTDLRIVALSALFFVPAILGAVFPQYQLWILVPFNLLVFFGLAWVWSPGRMDRKLELKRQREGNEP